MDLEMNRRNFSENDCEAWVAERKKDLAELQRLTIQINLRKRYEIRQAAQQRHPQTHMTVEQGATTK
jgi:hypothetical protein